MNNPQSRPSVSKYLTFLFVLAASITGLSAATNDDDTWKELSAFHQVMSQTFHPMEEGDLKPIRSRAAEMAEKAKLWHESTPPKTYDKPEIKEKLAKLVGESKSLAGLVADNAADEQIKQSLMALHDRFHEIIGLCHEAKKN